MKRPHIVCHILTALDGRIAGPFMKAPAINALGDEYERINETYQPQAWLCGRVTTDENFTFYRRPPLDEAAPQVPDGDYVAVKGAGMHYVSVDPSGKLGWETSSLNYEDRPAAHIVEVLTEKASNAYRAFLRGKEISYIIAGADRLDCKVAAEKLKALFGIETLVLSGGGAINCRSCRPGWWTRSAC